MFKKICIRRRFAALIALFAIIVHAAAPIVAHAAMAQAGSSWIALCTAHGMVQIQVANDALGVSDADRPLKIKPGQPCALCALAATAPPPVPFITHNFHRNIAANALFVSLDGTSLVFAGVVQHHAPPTGPPPPSFA